MNFKHFKQRLIRAYAKQRVRLTLKTELIPCPLCNADNFEILHSRDRYNLPISTVKCAKCGLVFENPMPTEQFLNHFYTTHLYRALDWGVINPTPKTIAEFSGEERSQKHLTLIKKLISLGLMQLPGSLLDVGSSEGSFAKGLMKEFPAVSVNAVEPGQRFSSLTSSGVIVYPDIKSIPRDKKFDLITLWHVFEHIRDPKDFLFSLSSNLSEKGTLIIEVPDLLRHEGIRSFHIDDLYHYSEETLTAFASHAGLVPVYTTRDKSELMDDVYGMAVAFRHR